MKQRLAWDEGALWQAARDAPERFPSPGAMVVCSARGGSANAHGEWLLGHAPERDDRQVLADETFETVGTQRVSDDTLWLLADHQGTIRDIADSNGVLRKHVDYDSFGRHLTFATGSLFAGATYYDASGQQIAGMQPWTHADAVAVDQLFGYTGQEWDEEAGLDNNNARWYNPETGRWLSEDPTGFAGGDANLYRYVGNSPLNGVDPTGTTQAGNPPSNLDLYDKPLGGGYSGNKVSANKPVSTAIASGFRAAGNDLPIESPGSLCPLLGRHLRRRSTERHSQPARHFASRRRARFTAA